MKLSSPVQFWSEDFPVNVCTSTSALNICDVHSVLIKNLILLKRLFIVVVDLKIDWTEVASLLCEF